MSHMVFSFAAIAAKHKRHMMTICAAGFAVADIDYGGSTGYGREYRNRLRESWGRYRALVSVHTCVVRMQTHQCKLGSDCMFELCQEQSSRCFFVMMGCCCFAVCFVLHSTCEAMTESSARLTALCMVQVWWTLRTAAMLLCTWPNRAWRTRRDCASLVAVQVASPPWPAWPSGRVWARLVYSMYTAVGKLSIWLSLHHTSRNIAHACHENPSHACCHEL